MSGEQKHTPEEKTAFIQGWVAKHRHLSDENAALKESLAELMPIAEFHQQHLMHYSIVFPAMREKALEYKAAIDRAKKLIAENREQSRRLPPQGQES